MELPTQQWPEGVLVVTPAVDTRSPMWRKMWQRAGYDPARVRWADLANWVLPEDVHGLIVLGEDGLTALTHEHNLFRWRGRTRVTYSFRRPVTLLHTMRVVDLLPRQQLPTDTQLSNRPSRFQGVWVRDVQAAIQRAGTYVTQKTRYLLDPKQPAEWNAWHPFGVRH